MYDLRPADNRKESYEGICNRLGFIPEIHFVKIYNDGSVGWTVGKPDEIAALRDAVKHSKYRMSRGLRQYQGH